MLLLLQPDMQRKDTTIMPWRSLSNVAHVKSSQRGRACMFSTKTALRCHALIATAASRDMALASDEANRLGDSTRTPELHFLNRIQSRFVLPAEPTRDSPER